MTVAGKRSAENSFEELFRLLVVGVETLPRDHATRSAQEMVGAGYISARPGQSELSGGIVNLLNGGPQGGGIPSARVKVLEHRISRAHHRA